MNIIERVSITYMDSQKCQHVLDVQGLRCPMPVIQLNKTMRKLTLGEHIKILVNDTKAIQEIKEYCKISGYTLIEETNHSDGSYRLIIEKTAK